MSGGSPTGPESLAESLPTLSAARTGFGDLVARAARYRRLLLLAPLALFMIAFFLFPLLWLIRISFAASPDSMRGEVFYSPGTWTLDNYVKFFTDPFFLEIAGFTLQLGVLTALIATLLSYALAYHIYRSRPWVKSLLLAIVIMPKFTNMLVLMYGFLIVFGSAGLINEAAMAIGLTDEPFHLLYNFFSVLIGEVVLVMPYCVLVLVAVLHSIDRSLLEAASGLGANPLRAFWEITLPLSLPGLSVSLLLSFIWGLGAFVAPHLLGTPSHATLAVAVDNQVNWRLNWALGSAIGFVLMVVVLIMVGLLTRLQRDHGGERKA